MHRRTAPRAGSPTRRRTPRPAPRPASQKPRRPPRPALSERPNSTASASRCESHQASATHTREECPVARMANSSVRSNHDEPESRSMGQAARLYLRPTTSPRDSALRSHSNMMLRTGVPGPRTRWVRVIELLTLAGCPEEGVARRLRRRWPMVQPTHNAGGAHCSVETNPHGRSRHTPQSVITRT